MQAIVLCLDVIGMSHKKNSLQLCGSRLVVLA